MRPTIAAVVVARDEEAVIGRALASIAGQTRAPDRLVVVDDGSSDATAAIARAAGATVLDGAGRGEAAARNLGVAEAGTSHVAFLDADDRWPPGYLAEVADVLESTGARLVVAGTVERNEQGVFVRERPPMTALTPTELYVRGGFKPSSSTIEVRAILDVGGFDDEQDRSNDLGLALRLLGAGVVPVRTPARVEYQVRDTPESRQKLHAIELGRERLHEGLAGSLVDARVADRAKRQRDATLARRYLKGGHRRDARRMAIQSLPEALAFVVLVSSLLPAGADVLLTRLIRAARALRRALRR